MNSVFDVFDNAPSEEIEKCEGLYIHTLSGKKILDMSGGSTSVMILGWQHKKINEALIAQLSKFSHIDYKAWRDPNVHSLSNLIVSNSPAELSCVYFCGNSGAEACETAMKMSFLYHQAKGDGNKTKFIGRLQSYHGSTLDALSLTDRPNLRVYQPLLPNNKIIIREHNFLRHALDGETQAQYLNREIIYLEQVILEQGPENIAGFIGETIQGGLVGDVPPVENYWYEVRKLCDKYNMHLILDEVYCGTGTTGKYHSFEYDNVVPDFVMLAKTLCAGYSPLSAVITKSSIKECIHQHYEGRLAHSTTMQGFSLGVAVAIEVQKILSNKDFLNNVFIKGEYFRNTIHEQLKKNPYYKNVRGRGLRFSVEHSALDNNLFAQKISEGMRKRGIYIDSKWHKTGFTPALTITPEQIEFVADSFISVFNGIR